MKARMLLAKLASVKTVLRRSAQGTLVRNSFWVVAGFGLGQGVRLVSSIILARILAPEIFGIMVIVFSVRGGIDLLSDIGVQQSIVANKSADQPVFYNTAWTLRLVRGLLVFALCALLAKPLAEIYQMPLLAWILPVVGLSFPIIGLGSLGPIFLQKRLQTAKLSIFDLTVEAVTAVSQVVFAWFSPTVWAFVFGGLIAATARSLGSYLIVPDLRHRFHVSKDAARQLLTFGSWIFLSSLIYFLSSNFDRLYLGSSVPLEILGIYGIARNLAEISNSLASRLNLQIIFPFIAGQSEKDREQLHRQVRNSRMIFLLLAATGLASLVISADWIVKLLYDRRYWDAGWMLAVLSVGVWFSIICTINESSLLGFGKPQYAVYANTLKLIWLIAGLPTLVMAYGISGAVVAILLSDVWRYIPIFIGQHRERFSFGRQDIVLTAVFVTLIFVGEWIRQHLGFGLSFSAML